jgi:hypothetical protein
MGLAGKAKELTAVGKRDMGRITSAMMWTYGTSRQRGRHLGRLRPFKSKPGKYRLIAALHPETEIFLPRSERPSKRTRTAFQSGRRAMLVKINARDSNH